MIQALGKNIILAPIKEDKSPVILRIETAPECYRVLSIGEKVESVAIGDIVFVTEYAVRKFVNDGQVAMSCEIDAIHAKKV